MKSTDILKAYLGNVEVKKIYLGSTLVYGGDDGGGGIPSRYIECDWIASANASYIDTGIKPNPNYSIEVVAKIYKYANNGYYTLFGTRNGNNARFTMRDNNNSTVTSFLRSTSATTAYAYYDHSINRTDRANSWYTYGLYKNLAKINGTVVNTFDESTSTVLFPYNLYLSANNNAGSVGDYGYYYFKSCKIWDDSDTLVRDYVPAYDTLSGKFGLFDKVESVFSSSGSANEFVGNLRNVTLPSGYTQLDFIRFTGSQTIRFEETVSPTDCFEMEWKWNTLTKQQRALLSGYYFVLYINGSTVNAFNYGSTAIWKSTGANADYGHNYMLFDGLNKSFFINAHATTKTLSLSSYTAEGTASYWILGSNASNGQYASMDLYGLKRYVSGNMTRNLIPCVNSNEIYGFYDIVTDEFRTPTNSTTLSGGYIKD